MCEHCGLSRYGENIMCNLPALVAVVLMNLKSKQNLRNTN